MGKGASQDEDPYHQHHLSLAGTCAKDVDALSQGDASRDGDGIGRSHHEGNGDGYFVKVTSDNARD